MYSLAKKFPTHIIHIGHKIAVLTWFEASWFESDFLPIYAIIDNKQLIFFAEMWPHLKEL